ncbi:MAG: alginate export family protein [Gammaproteobacteria bacterium]
MGLVGGMMLISLASSGFAEEGTASTPWRLHDALGLPTWLTLAIEHRTRYETIDNQFRKSGTGGDQAISFRTNVFAEAAYAGWRLGGEFIDSRVTADDEGTPLDNTLVNEADLLQAYLGWGTNDLLGTGLSADIKGGRETIDLGSRRLVARNAFRNTINAFTGLDVQLGVPNDWQIRSFFVLPVFRLPSDVDQIRNERMVFDREDAHTYLWGLYARKSQLLWNTNGEIYLLGLHEDDVPSLATRNRRLYTPGIRWFKEPATGQIDLEIEAAYQVGTSRGSATSTDTTDLDHAAHFEHAQVGYTLGLPWSPRFLAQYDYASGDDDPNDGNNNRFDTLFGARRFEFGPTGIWGAFARSNINSPGYRLIVKPHQSVSAMIGHRLFWLASDRDAWTTTPVTSSGTLQDTTGLSGDFIGHQIEASIFWNVIPKNLTLEAGWAHLIKGEFAKNAPDAPLDQGDSNYFYAQTTVQF